jgi:hypothetical protein
LLLGVETVGIPPTPTGFSTLRFDFCPLSRSLLMAVGWSALALGLALWRRCPTPVTFLLAALVFGHWVVDYVSHLPDLPLWPGQSPWVDLGLWRSAGATQLVEGSFYGVGSDRFDGRLYYAARRALTTRSGASGRPCLHVRRPAA